MAAQSASSRAPSAARPNLPQLNTSVSETQATAEPANARLSVGALLRRRARYVARAAYYIAIHRSLAHWRWALAAEGTQWN